MNSNAFLVAALAAAASSSSFASSLALLHSSGSRANGAPAAAETSLPFARKPSKPATTASSKDPASAAPGGLSSTRPGDVSGGPNAPAAAATSTAPPVVPYPVTDKTRVYTVRATYYGPDEIHGIHGGNDNIFEHVPAGQYTPSQLKTIGKHFCAMSEKFLRKGFMGAIVRVTGVKATMDFVVVDMLPDRNDGKNVEIDVHDQKDWLALGGDVRAGMQQVTFKVVGKASIPVPSNSPWDPKKFGF